MAMLPKKSLRWKPVPNGSQNLRPQPQIYVEDTLSWMTESLEEVLDKALGSQYDIQVVELIRVGRAGSHAEGDKMVVVYERGTEKAVLTFLRGS